MSVSPSLEERSISDARSRLPLRFECCLHFLKLVQDENVIACSVGVVFAQYVKRLLVLSLAEEISRAQTGFISAYSL
jgi:hypothetical protein